MSSLRKRLEELEALNAEAISERDRLDKICREMIVAMKAAEGEWAAEKLALTDDRNHWFARWQHASNEVLQRTPATRFKKPGPLPKPNAEKGKGTSLSDQGLLDRGHTEDEIRGMFSDPGQVITAESMADYDAGKTFSWDELWAKIDTRYWREEVMTFDEMDQAKATRGIDKESLALLTLLGLSSQDVDARRVSPLAEALSAIRNADPIQEGIREHMRQKHKTPLQAEVERLQARVKQLVDETLAEASMDPTQLRMAVIRQLALDLDPPHEPDMDQIQAEVREVRRARAKRKGQ